MPEKAHAAGAVVCDDPMARVLLASDREALPPSLVAAVNQNVLRGVVQGVLHEPGLGYWYRHAAVVEGTSYAYHQLLPPLLSKLDGVTAREVAFFAREPQADALSEWTTMLYALYRRVLPRAEGPRLEAPAAQERLGCALPSTVRRIRRAFARYAGLRLFLHGSLATCDTTRYSDVDLLLIVDHAWLESPARFSALRRLIQSAQRWLYRYDPLQHHGFMVSTALDLERYAHHYFPLELLRYAYPLTPGPPIRYVVRDTAHESRALLHGVWRRLVEQERGIADPPASRYALKARLSELMLIPSYFLQSVGRVLYKRDSFAAVRPYLSPVAQGAMDALSEWRRRWRFSTWDRLYKGLGALPPEPVARRLLARARACPPSAADMERWRAVVPGARLMAEELLERASAGPTA